MTIFFTIIFLVASAAVLIPVSWVGWIMYQGRHRDGGDIEILARTLFYVTIANLLFHAAQFVTVLLGALGVSMQSRIPIIILIDGSLVLLTITYFYALRKVREIRNRQ